MDEHPGLVTISGRPMWRFAGGELLPVVSGGDGPVTRTLEDDILDLRKRIASEEETEARLRKDAQAVLDQVQDDVEKRGKDRWDPEIIKRVDEAFREPDEKKDRIAELRAHQLTLMERAGQRPDHPTHGEDRAARRSMATVGRAWTESDVYLRTRDRIRTGGNQARIETDPIELLSRQELVDGLRQRATFDAGTGGALIPIDQQVYPPISIPVRPVRLLDLITMAQTDSDQVKWAQQTVRQDAAAPVPYGQPAPFASYAYQPVTTTVERIPVAIPATKDQLADQAQTQSLLENQLRSDVLRQLEYQTLTGPGGNGNFTGILNTPGIGAYVRSLVAGPPAGSPEYVLDAIHKGITLVRLSLFDEPDGIGLHPTTAEDVWLSKDQYGRYLYPTGTEQQVLWGKPVVVTPLFAVGTSVVAQWKQAYTVWMRAGLGVFASDGYMDFFLRGMVAIMAELRAAGACQQPRAVCVVTGL